MNDKPYTSKALREAYREGAERFGWERALPAPRSMKRRQRAGRLGHGTGIWEAHVHEDGGARATLAANGHLEVASRDLRHRHRHLHGDDAGRGRHARHCRSSSITRPARRLRPARRAGRRRLVDGGLGRRRGAAGLPGGRREAASRPRGKVEGEPLGDADVRRRRVRRRRDPAVTDDPSRVVSLRRDHARRRPEQSIEAEETAKPGTGGMISRCARPATPTARSSPR